VGCIRFLLALSVIIAHSESIFGLKLIGGSAAVEIFFMISGFYMALILQTKYVNKSDYSLFISNRFLKIYPVYILSIILICLISIVSLYTTNNFGSFDVYNQNIEHLNLSTLITLTLVNIVIFGQDLIMFLGIDLTNSEFFFTTNFRESTPHLYEFMLNPPAWSISVELLFYIIAPLILRKSTFVLLVITLVSLGIKIYLSYGLGLKNDPWSYRFFPSELMFFMLGAIAYNFYRSEMAKKFQVFNKKSNVIFLSLLLLAIFTYGYLYKLKYFLYLVSFISLPFIFDLSKRSNLDRSIGELSYPMYILHFTFPCDNTIRSVFK